MLLGPEWAIFGVGTWFKSYFILRSTHIDYPLLFSDNGSIWTLTHTLEFLVGEQGWKKPGFFLIKPNPAGFFGFYWAFGVLLGFIGFFWFLLSLDMLSLNIKFS